MNRFVLSLILLFLATGASAAQWQLGEAPTLGFVGSYMGESFEGRFDRFTADIRLDQEDLQSAGFEVEIDVTSAATGIAEYDEGMQEAEFFDGARYPSARFTARNIRAVGDGAYEADGELTIRNQTASMPFPFRFQIDGEQARLEANLTLKRLAFDIGTGDWSDTSLIADEVEVRVDLPLTRSP